MYLIVSYTPCNPTESAADREGGTEEEGFGTRPTHGKSTGTYPYLSCQIDQRGLPKDRATTDRLVPILADPSTYLDSPDRRRSCARVTNLVAATSVVTVFAWCDIGEDLVYSALLAFVVKNRVLITSVEQLTKARRKRRENKAWQL